MVEQLVHEWKQLLGYLWYVFLGENNNFPVIVAADLNVEQVQDVVKVLKRLKQHFGWAIDDVTGIFPGIYTHKIQLEEDCSSSIEN
ncbi:hypothetical protein H5410_003324 [Solanum commersonii]|uniref:Uncharacterized protein n=1 Tax=Solanum commersonii TaxID=4109 RepID=A0A9J6B5B8_SOLCO|nr:hypothetical protein H5410_003324 [Solanum commersonii]